MTTTAVVGGDDAPVVRGELVGAGTEEAVQRTGLSSAIVLLHGTTVGTNSLLQRRGARVARDPRDFISMTFLGGSYMQKARETGDLIYYQLAEKGLKKSLELESEHPQAATAFAPWAL